MPQLQLVVCTLPVYEVVDISIRIINHIYLFGGGAAMSAKEKKGALLPACVTIFIGGALELLVAWVVSEALATPLGQ